MPNSLNSNLMGQTPPKRTLSFFLSSSFSNLSRQYPLYQSLSKFSQTHQQMTFNPILPLHLDHCQVSNNNNVFLIYQIERQPLTSPVSSTRWFNCLLEFNLTIINKSHNKVTWAIIHNIYKVYLYIFFKFKYIHVHIR